MARSSSTQSVPFTGHSYPRQVHLPIESNFGHRRRTCGLIVCLLALVAGVATAGEPSRPVTGGKDRAVFGEVVQPILTQYCAACHGLDKQKGSLRLDSFANIIKGGDSGPCVIPGKSADSAIVKRLSLPPDEDNHMPPRGKPQPTPDQIALLKWWIDAGAPADKLIADLRPTGHIAEILGVSAAPVPTPAEVHSQPKPLGEIKPIIDGLSNETGVVIVPIAAGQPWLSCNASLARSFGDAQIAQLLPLAANLQSLNLAGTTVSDSGLAHVAKLTALGQLHLERTAITDAGLKHLTPLRRLEYLNLYGTAITDQGLQSLKPLASLRRVYVWNTRVTPEAARAMADTLTDKSKVEKWRQEIAEMQAKIRAQEVVIDTGSPMVAETQRKAINTVCPVTGKPVVAGKIMELDGRVVGFCCDDCLAAFKKNPKAYSDKLPSAPTRP